MAVSTNGSAILLTSASQSVTIPASTSCVLFLWSYWNAVNGNGLTSATLNGVAPTSSGEATTTDTGNAVGWAKFDAPSSGSQTFAYTLDATATEGPIRILVPLQGTTPTVRIAPTPVRNTSAGGTDALSISLTGLTVGDFCIMLDEKFGGTPPGTPAGWTSHATQSNNSDSGRVSYISAAGTSVTANAQNVDFSSLVALALYEAGGAAYSLTANQGSYSLTGQAATLRTARTMSAEQGSYALSGQATSLRRGLMVGAGPGSYSLTGLAAALRAMRSMAAGQGSYALNGQDVTLSVGALAKLLTAGQGAYSLNGQDARIVAVRIIAAAAGSYALTGQPAALRIGLHITAGQGIYSLSGQDSVFALTRALAAAVGSYTLIGSDASLNYSAAPPVLGSFVIVRRRRRS